jgi:hypothetical protein
MLKKLMPVLLLPLLLAGCTTTFTNLTPRLQERNEANVYPVEVALSSNQQSLRWGSIRPQIIVGTEAYDMRQTSLMTNRWEGLIPVPAGVDQVVYRYRFDFDYNAFGKPKADVRISPEYTLKIVPARP